ncbi:Transcriptional adapter ada2 [Coemansia sp. RSA 2610]|nr:Transcriptional adapter ada2 [Coemansia sp. RSA 2705]KAJ2358935.1 Transcriptional adapter ada2 [Coemansia sp. RSA 2610]
MQTREDFEQLSLGLLNEHALRQRIAQLQEWRRNGITTLEDGAQYEVERSQRLSRRATTQRDSVHLLERLQKIVASRTIRDSASGSAAQRQLGRKPAGLGDIESAEGVELLSESEKDVCARLRLFPRPYLAVKESLLAEYARVGQLARRRACDLAKIDQSKAGPIYDFFVEAGWIKPLREDEDGLAMDVDGPLPVNAVAAMDAREHPAVKSEY